MVRLSQTLPDCAVVEIAKQNSNRQIIFFMEIERLIQAEDKKQEFCHKGFSAIYSSALSILASIRFT